MTDYEALKNTFYIVAAILVHRHLPQYLALSWGTLLGVVAFIMAALK